MAGFSAVLLDADAGVGPVETTLDARSTSLSFPKGGGWSVRSRVLHGGLSDGVFVVDVCSGPMTVSLLPTRGMGLWKAECDGVPVGWDSPVKRPVHPAHVDLNSRHGLGWLDGFNELLCRCGLSFNGPPGLDGGNPSPVESQLTLHGRMANLPAHRVDVSISPEGEIAVTGEVDECTMFGPQLRLRSTVRVRAGERTIAIEDQVQNLASHPAELQLLYHINIGKPFLDGGANVLVPSSAVSPRDARAAEGIDEHNRYLPPTPGYAEQVYYFDPLANDAGEAIALLSNAAADRGFAVRFAREQLPCFAVWKCTQADADGYVTGLEPGTGFPNFKTFEREQGRVRSLAPGETSLHSLQLDVLTTAERVADSRREAEKLAASRPPVIHRQPAAGFAPSI